MVSKSVRQKLQNVTGREEKEREKRERERVRKSKEKVTFLLARLQGIH